MLQENLIAPQNGILFDEAMNNLRKNTTWWAIAAAFDLTDFNPSPIWFANRLNLTLEEVISALEGLVALGFVERKDGGYFAVPGKDYLEFAQENKTKREIIDDHRIVSMQILNNMNENAYAMIDERFFATDEETMEEFYRELKNLMLRTFDKSKKLQKRNFVAKMTFSCINAISDKE